MLLSTERPLVMEPRTVTERDLQVKHVILIVLVLGMACLCFAIYTAAGKVADAIEREGRIARSVQK